MTRLAGRTAIVTGGAKGIGRHYSQALAGEGAEVMIADIADGSALAAELAAQYGRNATTSATFDVSDEGQVKALVATTIERFGKIDILVNNPSHVQSVRANAVERRAIKRDAYPADLIGALIFLASADSDFVTGQTIAVDGGAVNT